MTNEVDIFSNFYVRKQPIITYKRKQTYSNFTTNTKTTSSSINDYSVDNNKRTNYLDIQGKENIKNDTTLLNKNNFNVPTKTPVLKKDVFDFPEEDSDNAQVEIRVATTFHTNKHHHQNITNNKRTIEKVTNSNELQYKKAALTKPKRPTFSRTKSAPQDLRMMNSTNTLISPSSSILNNNNNNHHNKIDSFILPPSISTSFSSFSNHNNNKKQQHQHKRNLVSRLKSADGMCNNELSSNGLRLYDTINKDDHNDDDNDDDIFSNRQNHQKILGNEPIISQIPTINNNNNNNNNGQNMKKDINELLRSELGEEFINSFNNPSDLLLDLSNELFNNNDYDYNLQQKQDEENDNDEEKQRPRYIPENKIRASVTYKRSHQSHKNDIDSELERQIHELLS